MATYYKYAERSAESQINWAEIGKNMTDMLKEQEKLRQDKINALDTATRDFGNELSTPPQGEHKPLNQWALEYGDNASKFMLMQEKLFKSGEMKLKDYTIGRQNLIDGTKQAFDLTKDFQSTFSEKMERYKKGESQDLEIWLNGQAEKFGDFTKSQLYINPTDGTVNVAMKEKRIIGGKEVYTMSKNPNDFTTINSLRNSISSNYDKFDSNAVTDQFVTALGTQETSSIILGTISKGGTITTIEDIKKRTDLDEDGKTVLFKFIDAENQMISAALSNPYNRTSVLTNTLKFAPNGNQYTFTYNEDEAKSNPELILLRLDGSGRPTPIFSKEQEKASNEALRTEARAKYDYKEKVSPTAQAQIQSVPEYVTKGRATIEDQGKVAGAWNQLYTGKTASEKKAAADILLGTPIAQDAGLIGIDLTEKGKIKLEYNNNVKDRTISYLDSNGNPIPIRDFSGLGVELHGIVDRDKAVKAAGGTGVFGEVGDQDLIQVVSRRRGGVEGGAEQVPINIPESILTAPSQDASVNLQSILPSGFTVTDDGGRIGNKITITAPNKAKYKTDTKLSASKVEAAKKGIEAFIKLNTTSGGVGAKY